MNLIEHKTMTPLEGLLDSCYVLPSGRSQVVTLSSPLKSGAKFPLALMATRPALSGNVYRILIAESENTVAQSICCVDSCNKTEICILLVQHKTRGM